MPHATKFRHSTAMLIAGFVCALGCRGQQATLPNPFTGADRVPPPAPKMIAPGTATPYYQGDPLPPFGPTGQQQLNQPAAAPYPAAPAWPQSQTSFEEPVAPAPLPGIVGESRISLLDPPEVLPGQGVVLTGGEAASNVPLQWGPTAAPAPEFQSAPPPRISFPGQ